MEDTSQHLLNVLGGPDSQERVTVVQAVADGECELPAVSCAGSSGLFSSAAQLRDASPPAMAALTAGQDRGNHSDCHASTTAVSIKLSLYTGSERAVSAGDTSSDVDENGAE